MVFIAYNLRITEHGNGTQTIKYYMYPVTKGSEELTEDNFQKFESGEIVWDEELLRKYGKAVEPFSGSLVDVCDDFELLTPEEKEKRAERSLQESVARSKRAVYEKARSRRWEWFLTFTFNGEHIDRYNYTACFKKIKGWIHDYKKRHAPEMAYIIVPEMHKDGAWHFHGLFANMGDSIFKVATNNDKDSPYYGQPLRVCYPDGDYIYNLFMRLWQHRTIFPIWMPFLLQTYFPSKNSKIPRKGGTGGNKKALI